MPLLKDKQIGILSLVDSQRLEVFRSLDQENRGLRGQYPTPSPVASKMARMFEECPDVITLLDPGAGIGSLTAAFVQEILSQNSRPSRIVAYAYEVEPKLLCQLRLNMSLCESVCADSGIMFIGHVVADDFIKAAREMLLGGLFSKKPPFNRAILNPPYYKINSNSSARQLLREVGIETSNIYAAFTALVIQLLEPNGEMVSITPRSFCNGPYFKPFRDILLSHMDIKRIHLFESRKKSFKDDEVLQETVILYAQKSLTKSGSVIITKSESGDDLNTEERIAKLDEVVIPNDTNKVIHLVTSTENVSIAQLVRKLPCTLCDIGISVSTGRVVDFRFTNYLTTSKNANAIPLIYPTNFQNGKVKWPIHAFPKGSLGILSCPETLSALVPNESYVLVKRFSSKEERRRIVACVFNPKGFKHAFIGFENHLNYYHSHGRGLPPALARGLATYLNASFVDSYFRQFSGHTQVNATDLKAMRYPTKNQLLEMGRVIKTHMPNQSRIDEVVSSVLNH